MKPSTKAALLSALVFPGVGQISLRFYRRGAILAAVALGACITLVTSATRSVLRLLESMDFSGNADFTTIHSEASKAAVDFSSPTIFISFTILLACWIAAVIDGWVLGDEISRKQRDRPSRE